MSRNWLIGIGVLAVAVVVAAVAAVATRGGGEETSAAEYEVAVVEARDRVDFALNRIATPTSQEDLLNRIDDAGGVAKSAARNLDRLSVEGELGAENDRLVRTLEAFSAELTGTAATLRDPAFGDAADSVRTLSFNEWTRINAILKRLQNQGVDVELLGRH